MRALPLLFAFGAATAAAADPVVFAAKDVPTVFFLSPSDLTSRVDYGLRLDAHCEPVSDEPLFPYWHEPDAHKSDSLKFFEYAAYGVKEQKIKKLAGHTELTVTLKAVPRAISITVAPGEDGKCAATAHTLISGQKDAELLSAFIQVKPMWRVDYVEIRGRTADGKERTERLAP
jgi:hypothetical protein